MKRLGEEGRGGGVGRADFRGWRFCAGGFAGFRREAVASTQATEEGGNNRGYN